MNFTFKDFSSPNSRYNESYDISTSDSRPCQCSRNEVPLKKVHTKYSKKFSKKIFKGKIHFLKIFSTNIDKF